MDSLSNEKFDALLKAMDALTKSVNSQLAEFRGDLRADLNEVTSKLNQLPPPAAKVSHANTNDAYCTPMPIPAKDPFKTHLMTIRALISDIRTTEHQKKVSLDTTHASNQVPLTAVSILTLTQCSIDSPTTQPLEHFPIPLPVSVPSDPLLLVSISPLSVNPSHNATTEQSLTAFAHPPNPAIDLAETLHRPYDATLCSTDAVKNTTTLLLKRLLFVNPRVHRLCYSPTEFNNTVPFRTCLPREGIGPFILTRRTYDGS